MASYGEFLSNGWYSSSKGDYVYLEFAWVVTSTDIEKNETTIYWEFRGKRAASGYVMSGPFKLAFDDKTVYSSASRIELRNGTIIATGSNTFTHNNDGTRSFEVYMEGAIYDGAVNRSGKATFTLDTIPRQATLTAAPDFTDLENPTITYSNPAGNSVTSLMACISFTGAADDIVYRHVSKTDGAYTFELTDAERDVLREGTQGSSRSVIFHLRTYIGNSTYYSVLRKTLTIAESEATRPVVSMDATLNNGSLPAKFADLWIQGKSRVDISLFAEGKYNATISRYSAQVDGKTYIEQEFTSDVIQSSGDVEIIGYARDSREITGSVSQTVNVIEYSKPLVIPGDGENAILCYRSDGNGKRIGNSTSVWIKAKKSYYSVEGKNTCSLLYRVKPVTDPWEWHEDWEGLIYGDESQEDEYNGLIDWVFDLKTSYTVQIMAIDDIGEYDLKTFEIPTQDVALHLGKGGKNVSVGTYCDYSRERTFYSDWDAIFDKSINGAYIKTVHMEQGNVLRLQSCFDEWSDDGEDLQSFLVFGNVDAYAALGTCVVLNTGQITEDNITNVTADVEGDGVVILRMEYDNPGWFVIISPRPFSIL